MSGPTQPPFPDIWIGRGEAAFYDYRPETRMLPSEMTVLGVNAEYVSVTRGGREVNIHDPAKARQIMDILRQYDSNGVKPSERAILNNIASDALDNGRLDQSIPWMPSTPRTR